MIFAKTARAASRRSVDVQGCEFWRRDYFGHAEHAGEPHAYLVEQPAGAVVPTHFHTVDQFQVVVHGSGRLARDEIAPLTAHYTDAFTGYGPIEADDDGLFYFTLRAQYDPGAQYLPEARARRPRVRGRHRLATRSAASRPGTQSEALLEPEDDGLGMWMLHLEPDATSAPPDPSEGGGQYLLALSGTFVHDGTEYDQWGCMFASADEPAPQVRAGADGAAILVLRFPHPRPIAT